MTTSNPASPAALFISDLHLQPALPATTEAFLRFLQEQAQARRADSLYLLGDIFEYWAGDDDLDTPYPRRIVDALRQTADAGVRLFWMAGNRDFLAGPAFAQAAGITLLPEIHLTRIAGHDVVLVHGDAQCTDDHAYMAFRKQVREPGWQQAFLSQPLQQRKQIIEGMRQGSRMAQREKAPEIMDVNPGAIDALFETSGAAVMIHGHTHRPARHETRGAAGLRLRFVLPDWDLDAAPPRGGWIAIESDGSIRRFDHRGAELR